MAITDPRSNPVSQDLIAILRGDNFRQVLVGADLMRVSVQETSQLPSFSNERGESITDHRVFDPIEISIPMLMSAASRNLFAELRQLWVDDVDLIVQTKMASYDRMYILEIPHEEDATSAIPVSLRLRRVAVFTPEYGTLPPRKVANKAQSDTVKSGSKQTTESDGSTRRKASVLRRILS